MNLRTFLAGATALALLVAPAFAAEYLGGAVKSADIGGKMVLTGSNDMTLYIFDKDTAGVSNCYDTCAEKWPPLFVDEGAMAEGDFSIVERPDGTRRVARGVDRAKDQSYVLYVLGHPKRAFSVSHMYKKLK